MIIPFAKPLIGDAEKHAVLSVLSRDRLTDGPEAERFEHDFATIHCRFGEKAVAVSSATAGLHLMFLAYGVKKLIVPALTHVATAHAALWAGAEVRFADCEDDGNISDRTVAEARKDGFEDAQVCGMHYLGKPCTAKMDFADSALSIGRPVTMIPSVFSFYPTKHITTGEGGMIVVPTAEMAARLRRLRAFGRVGLGKPNVVEFGLNYRMTEMQAAIGIQQLKRLPDILRARAQNLGQLSGGLRAKIPVLDGGDYALALKCDDSKDRDRLKEWLAGWGIETSIYYPIPVPNLTIYQNRKNRQERDYPNAQDFSDRVLCLPVGPHVGEPEVKYMADKVLEWLKSV